MGLFEPSEKAKLKLFRKHFLTFISDGTYTPARQQILFQWCKKIDLAWDVARRAVADDAAQLLHYQLRRAVAAGAIGPDAVAELRRLQRRLGLPDDHAALHKLDTMIEAKLKDRLIERAAYLSAAPAVASMRHEVRSYSLPPAIEQGLLAQIERQHQLARLTAGDLPVVQPSISLYPNEVCYMEAGVRFSASRTQQAVRDSGSGLLVVTSERLMILAKSGGVALRWNAVQRIRYVQEDALEIDAAQVATALFCADAQYVTTLIISAQRRAMPAQPTPLRAPKRLA